MTQSADVIILGAGGAGLMCAIEAGKRGRNVIVLDHAQKIGGKILISGGGRCNFTNLGATAKNYVSNNPHFAKSALSRYTPLDFIALVEKHGIPYHEKKLGQQFCDHSAQEIVDLLEKEANEAGVTIKLKHKIDGVEKSGNTFIVKTTYDGTPNTYECRSLVIATGGLSLPKLGATPFGHHLAKQFGHRVTPLEPALDGFVFGPEDESQWSGLAGVSADTIMSVRDISFRENVLFTHAGLSGPASLQVSLHWHKGESIFINFAPDRDLEKEFLELKKAGNRVFIHSYLNQILPARLAERFCSLYLSTDVPVPQISDEKLRNLAQQIHHQEFRPKSTVGYNKAEVTRGGVDTDQLSQKTLESKLISNLYFIGEVVDVTGWLGGYNFQWAWASGWAAGQVV